MAGQLDAAARRVRTIVESKENFAWATMMHSLYDIFEIREPGGTGGQRLGKRRAEEMTSRLEGDGLVCYPNPLPRGRDQSALITVTGSRFQRGFDPGK